MHRPLTRRKLAKLAALAPLAISVTAFSAPPQPAKPRANDTTGDPSPDARARETEAQMTDDERFSLIVSIFGSMPPYVPRDPRIPEGVAMSAGYTPGVPRLGVPALRMSDASLGITNPGFRPDDKGATALPASLAAGASFNPALVREAGRMLGREARIRGFNVMLAGGINLARDPRNGRNFEYYSEDPWVSAILGAAAVAGIQDEGVISTLKHFSLNSNETNRHWLDAVIDPAAHHESDLLAFEIAIERAQPGAIMAAYNKINGHYAAGNSYLLNEVLKGTWGYKGWVMSDWGATPKWEFALMGLDQESGAQLDREMWKAEPFGEPLRKAYALGKLPKARLSDMVRRILRSIYAVGIDRWGPVPAVDLKKHNAVALEIARQGIVLLKNDGVLPLASRKGLRIAVIGGFAQKGVAIGTGSSGVTPVGGYAAIVPIGGSGIVGRMRNLYLLPSSPIRGLREALPDAEIEFDPGQTPAEAAMLARRADVVVAFGVRVEGEAVDLADLSLPWGQDAVIEAVAAVNPNTIVVLETGNPASMPWRDKVKAIVQAWYPGQAGGQAIAEILTGKVNPSGRLPITIPDGLAQTPRPELSAFGASWGSPTTIRYDEGAEVGYRWYALKGEKPLYSFGHGLSYTRFAYRDLAVESGETISASFTVTNTGGCDGADVPQLYLTDAAGERRLRLLGFERVALAPGQSKRVTLIADPRLLARYDGGAKTWRIAAGAYRVALGKSASDLTLTAETKLVGRTFGA
jgi:beta-glucosidase